tara:strand:- start:214 stop:588 length:375 start_codon:yes stop_codon:yes gene_type:complete
MRLTKPATVSNFESLKKGVVALESRSFYDSPFFAFFEFFLTCTSRTITLREKMRLAEIATVSNFECSMNDVMRWRVTVDSVIRRFFAFFDFSHCGVHFACFWPSLNNTLAHKDTLDRTHRRYLI